MSCRESEVHLLTSRDYLVLGRGLICIQNRSKSTILEAMVKPARTSIFANVSEGLGSRDGKVDSRSSMNLDEFRRSGCSSSA